MNFDFLLMFDCFCLIFTTTLNFIVVKCVVFVAFYVLLLVWLLKIVLFLYEVVFVLKSMVEKFEILLAF